LIAGEQMSVQYFRCDPGHERVPEHSHEHEEVVCPVEGAYTISIDGEEHTVEAGEVFLSRVGYLIRPGTPETRLRSVSCSSARHDRTPGPTR